MTDSLAEITAFATPVVTENGVDVGEAEKNAALRREIAKHKRDNFLAQGRTSYEEIFVPNLEKYADKPGTLLLFQEDVDGISVSRVGERHEVINVKEYLSMEDTIYRVLESSRVKRGAINKGMHALIKKIMHAQAMQLRTGRENTSRFKEYSNLKFDKNNTEVITKIVEGLIRNIMRDCSLIMVKKLNIEFYNSFGRGMQLERYTGAEELKLHDTESFKCFMDASHPYIQGKLSEKRPSAPGHAA